MELKNNQTLSETNEKIKEWCEIYNCYSIINYNYKGEDTFISIYGGHQNVSHFKTLNIPEGVHCLIDGAFIGNNWENLKTIYIPRTMKCIEKGSIHRNKVVIKINPETIDNSLLNELIKNNYKIEFILNSMSPHNNIFINSKESIIMKMLLMMDELYKKDILRLLTNVTKKSYFNLLNKIYNVNKTNDILLLFKTIIEIYRAYNNYLTIKKNIIDTEIVDDNYYYANDYILSNPNHKYYQLNDKLRKENQIILHSFNDIKNILM